ncbi:MAG: DUF5060 domain-containing protein [Planctomycetota bacterium]|nr:DUF5060 domain-containing protein [Planctomycetota bacterium]
MINRIRRGIGVLGAGALGLAAPLASAQDSVYLMEDGLLVVEFESLDAAGDWALEDELSSHTGDGYLRWTGPDYFQQPGHDPFGVDFLVEENGTYDFRIRNHHDHPDSTEANDVWVRMDGGTWIKCFSAVKDNWTWASNHEHAEDDKPPASYDLTAGQHRLEFSGRSYDFRMDRFHLFTPGHPDGTKASAPESEKQVENLPPVARGVLSPPSIPADDNMQTIVSLDGRASFDPEGESLTYKWEVRGAKYVKGTNDTSPVAKVRLTRDGFVQPVRLTVTDPEGLERSVTLALGVDEGGALVRGEPVAWHPIELVFDGPQTHENASNPNPFLDYRLDVTWTSPDGETFNVPGFYGGDGEGNGEGNKWINRFAPDRGGLWTYRASFRIGEQVAIKLSPLAGTPTHFDTATGQIAVLARHPEAEGFLSEGRLEYTGEHYFKFRDGGYFLKGGTNSPENFLGYAGFDDVTDNGGVGIVHEYAPHISDFRPGDPLFVSSSTGVDSRGIIGALNYLGHQGINSLYFLPMNMGGDGQETTPFVGYSPSNHDRRHYDISRLHQWGQVFDHATRCGVLLHFVLAETEPGNQAWLDSGELGPERKLFFRELVARFGHALALKWNLSEENDYSISQLEEFATYLRAMDPYDHPIAVHTHPDNFQDYVHLVGSDLFDCTSIQYTPQSAGGHVEQWREQSANAGRKWVLDMDENGAWDTGLSGDNADYMRKAVLYDVYFSGGQIEWYAGYHDLPLGGDVKLEDFRTRQAMWSHMLIAREFMEKNLPFWEMEPADELVLEEHEWQGGAECLAKPGEVYAVYLPKASSSGKLDLTSLPLGGTFEQRWFNPRTGEFEGSRRILKSGKVQGFAPPPSDANQDWIVLVTVRTQP